MTTEPAPTSDQLRSEIDGGRAGDKVAFPDPAAAPLGADDEAAGTPPSAERRNIARKVEARRPQHAGAQWLGWGGLAVAILVGVVLLFWK